MVRPFEKDDLKVLKDSRKWILEKYVGWMKEA
jgi:hypothetical protein